MYHNAHNQKNINKTVNNRNINHNTYITKQQQYTTTNQHTRHTKIPTNIQSIKKFKYSRTTNATNAKQSQSSTLILTHTFIQL